MKKNKKSIQASLLMILVATLFFLTFVSAESCYVQFNLQERLVQLNEEDFTTSFSYTDLENLYGNYEGFVKDNSVFGESAYMLKVYDASNREIGSYSFDTSLLMFYDNFGDETNPGGIEVLNESVNSIIIPFNENIKSAKVFMNDTLLLEFYPTGIACERTCKFPGEFGKIGERCCGNYLESWISDMNFTCIDCGNGICSRYENEAICWEDCKTPIENLSCALGYSKSIYGCVKSNVCGNTLVEGSNGEECDDGDNFDFDGCSSDCKIEECVAGEGFIFSGGLDGEIFYDECKNESILIENYCGYDFSRWDFWNVFERVAKSKEAVCEFGCFDGKCLENPEIPAQNNITDLPDEPVKPGRL